MAQTVRFESNVRVGCSGYSKKVCLCDLEGREIWRRELVSLSSTLLLQSFVRSHVGTAGPPYPLAVQASRSAIQTLKSKRRQPLVTSPLCWMPAEASSSQLGSFQRIVDYRVLGKPLPSSMPLKPLLAAAIIVWREKNNSLL
jgi:hypothetical protein